MYNVAVDRAALREEILGPLFQRHVVSLSGTVDQRWLESFRSVAADSELFQRYRLDPEKGHISFTCRASDGPQMVDSFLERLALFVEMVNLHATCGGTQPDAEMSLESLSA
jgi:hypothetical protein